MATTVRSTDRETLRSLAGRVREIAEDTSMPQRRARWIAHNALKGERPMVLAFPEGAWDELLPAAAQVCQDPFLRRAERSLAQTVYWWEHIRDDNTVDPWFGVGWSIAFGDHGVEIPRHQGDNRGSFVWDPPIRDLEADFAQLHPRQPTVDREKTAQQVALLDSIFGDLLPVRVHSRYWWSVGLTQTLVYLIGLEQMLFAMMDQPEALHRLMAFLRDDMAGVIDWVEREGLLSYINESDYVGSGGVAWTEELPRTDERPGQSPKLHDLWGFGESQETVGISPAMFEEFIMPYQAPLLERFGLNCYGCCEPLESRIEVVKRHVPRLRRVSVAPMANQEAMASALNGDCIFSRKPDPVPVCVDFDEQKIRQDLRTTMAVAGQQPLEMIMKDTHTVQGEPWRIGRWVEIAFEEVDRYMGGD